MHTLFSHISTKFRFNLPATHMSIDCNVNMPFAPVINNTYTTTTLSSTVGILIFRKFLIVFRCLFKGKGIWPTFMPD